MTPEPGPAGRCAPDSDGSNIQSASKAGPGGELAGLFRAPAASDYTFLVAATDRCRLLLSRAGANYSNMEVGALARAGAPPAPLRPLRLLARWSNATRTPPSRRRGGWRGEGGSARLGREFRHFEHPLRSPVPRHIRPENSPTSL